MPESRSDAPLVWIDCEMTGLDDTKHHILSLTCILTTSALLPLTPTRTPHPLTHDTYGGLDLTIHHPPSILTTMDPWPARVHAATGLTAACASSTLTPATAATQLLAYIAQHIPEPRTALLAGSSVHADARFLAHEPWAPVLRYLHYRILDVSALKEAGRRWAGEEVLRGVPRKMGGHVARGDILDSLRECVYWRGVMFGGERALEGLGPGGGGDDDEGEKDGEGNGAPV